MLSAQVVTLVRETVSASGRVFAVRCSAADGCVEEEEDVAAAPHMEE